MAFNYNRTTLDLITSANSFTYTNESETSNLVVDLSTSNLVLMNLNPNSAVFRGFMANGSGLYFKSNIDSSEFISIGSGGTTFTPNIALELDIDSNLNLLYNPSIFEINLSNQLDIKSEGITNSLIANLAVTTEKLANLAVDTLQLANLAVTTEKLANLAVDTLQLANLSVTTEKLANLAVDTLQLANLSVTTEKLANLAVNTLQLANLAITTEKLANLAVTTEKLANLAVTTEQIANASIITDKLVNSSVVNSKIANAFVYIGDQTINLGSGLYSINGANIFGNIAANNVTVADTLKTTTANLTGMLYFGNPSNKIGYDNTNSWIEVTGTTKFLNPMTVSNTVTINGNLFVSGNTTYVDSNITVITDPVIYLGSNGVPNDGLDRGLAFRYLDNTTPKVGFMGFQAETQKFVYIPNATESPENNLTGALGGANFGTVNVDTNLYMGSASSYLLIGTSNNVGFRLNNGNLEVNSNSLGTWSRLYTPADIIAGAGLVKSGVDNLNYAVQVDESTLTIISDTVQVKTAGIANSYLANSNVIVDGTTLRLGSSYSNLALSLAAANNYAAANLTGTLTNSQLANSSITLSGTRYVLGTAYANISVNEANAVVFRSDPNINIRSLTTSNLDLFALGGNINLTASNSTVFKTNYAHRFLGDTGSNQFAIFQETTGNVYLNIGGTLGFSGYGLRSNLGNMEFKNNTGSWTGIGTGGGGGGTPGGLDTQVQFNDSSAFGGSSNFTFNKTTNNVAITGNVSVTETSAAKHLLASNTFTIGQFSSGLTSLSGTQTVTLDFGNASNFLITLSAGANITLGNPTNVSRLGQQGMIVVRTPTTGTSHVLNWYKAADSAWYFPDIITPPQISSGQNIYDVFSFFVVDTSSTGTILVTDATGFQRNV